MTKFRPCIDIKDGKVTQIIGSSLKKDGSAQANFVSERTAADFARMYSQDALRGGHMILLSRDKADVEAAKAALRAFPNGLQIGGGINLGNASDYFACGASHVILSSALFNSVGDLKVDELEKFAVKFGERKIVVDLSCKKERREKKICWRIARKQWRETSRYLLDQILLTKLAPFCDEFLIHAIDREGKQEGIDLELVAFLADCARNQNIKITYAGGVSNFEDLLRVKNISAGAIDLSVGSALDIFGGNGLRYQDCIAFNSGKL